MLLPKQADTESRPVAKIGELGGGLGQKIQGLFDEI